MVEACQNFGKFFGCEMPERRGLSPNAEIERLWAGEKGHSDSIPLSVTCKLTGQ